MTKVKMWHRPDQARLLPLSPIAHFLTIWPSPFGGLDETSFLVVHFGDESDTTMTMSPHLALP